MAKKTSVMATLAAVKRRFGKNRTSSIGWSRAQLPDDEPGEHDDADDEADEDRRVGPALGRGPR